jgi:AraC-like DNA-binding protein
MDAFVSSPESKMARDPGLLDRLLVTLDIDVQSFALCQVERGRRLIGEAVDAIMVHYVLAGTHYMTIHGYEPLVCSAGSIVVIPPALQPLVSLDGGPAVDVVAREQSTLTREGLFFVDATRSGAYDLRYVSGIVHASFFGSFGLFDNLTKPVAQHVGDYQIVQQAFGVMVDEVGSPSLGARALTSALMKACLVLMIRQTLEHGEQGSSIVGALSDRRLGKSIAAVLDRPSDPHTVQTMAEIAMMSRASFCRAFADAFDMTPKQFVAKTRLHHAAQMLRSTPLPIKTIAGSVGFSSRSHFSRAFSEAYGVDPSEFRAQTRCRPTDPPKAAH